MRWFAKNKAKWAYLLNSCMMFNAHSIKKNKNMMHVTLCFWRKVKIEVKWTMGAEEIRKVEFLPQDEATERCILTYSSLKDGTFKFLRILCWRGFLENFDVCDTQTGYKLNTTKPSALQDVYILVFHAPPPFLSTLSYTLITPWGNKRVRKVVRSQKPDFTLIPVLLPALHC